MDEKIQLNREEFLELSLIEAQKEKVQSQQEKIKNDINLLQLEIDHMKLKIEQKNYQIEFRKNDLNQKNNILKQLYEKYSTFTQTIKEKYEIEEAFGIDSVSGEITLGGKENE